MGRWVRYPCARGRPSSLPTDYLLQAAVQPTAPCSPCRSGGNVVPGRHGHRPAFDLSHHRQHLHPEVLLRRRKGASTLAPLPLHCGGRPQPDERDGPILVRDDIDTHLAARPADRYGRGLLGPDRLLWHCSGRAGEAHRHRLGLHVHGSDRRVDRGHLWARVERGVRPQRAPGRVQEPWLPRVRQPFDQHYLWL
eukprot:227011-Prymnesium_polylepis.1